MSMPPPQKTEAQIVKERACLTRCKLCTHNQWGSCNPPNGRLCNFAHTLAQLQPPEEGSESWWKIWGKGEVDIRFWKDYHPNPQSLVRFGWQFGWERKHVIHQIPHWAWGHALDLGLIGKNDVPKGVPEHFDWPILQDIWHRRKRAGAIHATQASPALLRLSLSLLSRRLFLPLLLSRQLILFLPLLLSRSLRGAQRAGRMNQMNLFLPLLLSRQLILFLPLLLSRSLSG